MKILSLNFTGLPKNYYTVDKNLSRSAQPNAEDFEYLKKYENITDIISFRFVAEDMDFNEQQEARKNGLGFHSIPTKALNPNEAGVAQFLNLMDKITQRNGKALIHCKAGIHRTGMYTCIYRTKKGMGTLDDNIKDWQDKGYHYIFAPHLKHFVQKYFKKESPSQNNSKRK